MRRLRRPTYSTIAVPDGDKVFLATGAVIEQHGLLLCRPGLPAEATRQADRAAFDDRCLVSQPLQSGAGVGSSARGERFRCVLGGSAGGAGGRLALAAAAVRELGEGRASVLSIAHTMSVVGDEPVRMLMILSNPARAREMVDTLERAFANGEPDPATVGPLLAQIDMEMLAPAVS